MPTLTNKTARFVSFRIKDDSVVEGSERMRFVPGHPQKVSEKQFETIVKTPLWQEMKGDFDAEDDLVAALDYTKMSKTQLVEACIEKEIEPEGTKSDLVALLELAADNE